MGFEKFATGNKTKKSKAPSPAPSGRGFAIFSASPPPKADSSMTDRYWKGRQLFKEVERKQEQQKKSEPKPSSLIDSLIHRMKTADDRYTPTRFARNPVVRGLNIATDAVTKGVTVGLSEAIPKWLGLSNPVQPTPETKFEKGLASASELAGSFAPIGGAYKVASQGLGRVLPKGTGLLAKTIRAGAPRAAAGATYEGAKAAIEGKPLPEIGKEAAIGAALYGGGDIALRGVLKGAKAVKGFYSVPKWAGDVYKPPMSPSTKPVGALSEALPKVGPGTKAPGQGPVGPVPSREAIQKVAPPVNEGAANAFRMKVNRNPKKKGTLKETLRKLQTQFVDDVAPLGRLEKDVRGGKLASAEDSLYKQARLFRGSPTKANSIVKTQMGPVVKEVEQLGHSTKDLGDYALAVHARDVNAQGINSGFSDAEIQAVISKYGTPEMEAARQKLVQVGNGMLDELTDAQVISRELVDTLRQKYPNYMPLFRSFDDDKVEFAVGMTKKMANVANPIKKLKGSERDVVDPLESMVKNVFQATNAADRNRVALQLAKLADEDATGQFIRRLAPGEEIGRKNAVYARVNGEKQYFEVDPEVYRSVLQLDKESSNFLIKILQKPASVLRAGATLTPEFSFRNPIRDVVQAYAVSKSGFKPWPDLPAAFFDIVFTKDKRLYRQFLADNAGFGNIVSMDRKVHQEALRQVLKEPLGQKFVNILNGKSLIGLLRNIADVSETATKLGEYRAALRSGASRPEAAYRARDIMDFSRAGTSIREANKIVAFLNANIQGKSKLLRAIRENPVGVTTRAVKAVTLPSIGVFLMQKYYANDEQRRTIDEAPAWLRDTFWLIPIPGTNLTARIPKPFDMAPLFANLPERTLDYIANNDPKAFDKFAQETFSTLSIPVMITGLLPFIEGMANYSFFRQAPIIPKREERIRQVDQGDINTTETSKLIAKGVYSLTGGEGPFQNLGSPRVIDHIILGLTAGLGHYATNAVDSLLQAGGALEKPPRPAKKLSEQPILRSFLVNENMPSNTLDTLYTERDRLRREKGSAESRMQPFQDIGKLKVTEKSTGDIGEVSNLMRQVEDHPTMSPQEKRRYLDHLRKIRDDIARGTVKGLGI